MKKYFIAYISLLFCVIQSINAQTSLATQLRNFPINNYLRKPIDTLLAHLPIGFDTTYVISCGNNLNSGASLQVNYPPNNLFWVDIHITEAQYITVQKDFTTGPPEVLWPLALLRKEKIGSVTIYTGAYDIINKADIY